MTQNINQRNKKLKRISYIYVGLFLLLIFNLIKYVALDSSNVTINSYNPRLEQLEKTIIRGKILDTNGQVLAQTLKRENELYRVYPFSNTFAHVLGYHDHGKTGLEAVANIDLLRSDISVLEKLSISVFHKDTIGNNVVTTLNAELQKMAHDLLGDRKGAVVAIEPSTGKILSMVSKPNYNPNYITQDWKTLIQNEEESPLLNRATQGLYPPGSTFKLITSLAFMENNPWEDFSYTCTGQDVFNGKMIHCYKNTAHGKVDLKKALAVSCNTAFSHIGTEMDVNDFIQTANRLLFNQTIDFDLPSSKSSFTLQENSTINEIAETAIGQGKTLISPFHNALIVSSIANGGLLMKPYLIDRIETYNGKTVKKVLPELYQQVMDVEYSTHLKTFMVEVVENGTGKKSSVDGIKIAGKTGSAENPFGQPHAWYVGFAPADNPKIALSIIVETSGTSSANAAPIAKELFDLYLKH